MNNIDGTPLRNFPQPYNDDYMNFDELSGHYVLTEKAIIERCAVDIRARLSAGKAVNPEAVINKLCRTVSDMIYGFIHTYSIHTERQDFVIAHNPQMRAVVQRAMEYQMDFFLANGDLFLSVVDSEQGKEINRMSQGILLDSGICYAGV